MRAIPSGPAGQARLRRHDAVPLLALTRRDGVVQGFTDHDEDVVLDGVTCRAGTGLTGSEATQQLGLAVGGSEISGALADDTLNEADLAAGRYDAAAIEIFLVDWSEPSLSRADDARACSARCGARARPSPPRCAGSPTGSTEESGRLYTATCAADLGDARCTVDLDDPAFRGSGTVTALDGDVGFIASGLDAFADGWFTAGRLTLTSGANDGPRGRGEEPSRRRRRRRARAVAGDAGADRGGRHLQRHGRLRQALRHLPRPLRQRRELPRLPAHSGQRFRHPLSRCPASPATTASSLQIPDAGHSRSSPAHADRRRGARLDRHALSAPGLAQGRRLRLPRARARRLARAVSATSRSARRPIRRTGRRRRRARRLARSRARASDRRSTPRNSRPATCCCSAGARACRPSMPPSSARRDADGACP